MGLCPSRLLLRQVLAVWCQDGPHQGHPGGPPSTHLKNQSLGWGPGRCTVRKHQVKTHCDGACVTAIEDKVLKLRPSREGEGEALKKTRSRLSKGSAIPKRLDLIPFYYHQDGGLGWVRRPSGFPQLTVLAHVCGINKLHNSCFPYLITCQNPG